MKKFYPFLLLLSLLLGGVSGVQAVEITIADFDNLPIKYGSLSGSDTFVTDEVSGFAGLTIATSEGLTMGSTYVNGDYGNCLSLTTSDTNTHTITLTAPEGYVIVGYSIGASANTSHAQHTLTAEDGTSVKITSYGAVGQFQYLNSSGLSAQSTQLTLQTEKMGNTLYVAYMTVSVMREGNTITDLTALRNDKAYQLKCDRGWLSTYNGCLASTVKSALGLSAKDFAIISYRGNYYLYSIEDEKFVTYGNSTGPLNAIPEKATLTMTPLSDGEHFQLFVEGTCVNSSAGYNYGLVINSYTTLDAGNQYAIYESGDFDPTQALAQLYEYFHPYVLVSSITSGKYYRLHNFSYTSLSMDGYGSVVSGVANADDNYAQVWQFTKSGSAYTIKNALTGEYIQNNTANSTQFKTGSSANAFTLSTGTYYDDTYFLFSPYLHCAATQSYKVVYWWDHYSEPSRWFLEEVTMTEEDFEKIAEAQSAVNNASSYTSSLSTFFSDYACTVLRSQYAGMTDDQLRSAMSSLPSALQEMAVRVKNDTWNADATWNRYEKDFRIHAYDIFSNCRLWSSITNIGPFAHLFHPTGIQAQAGDVIYIFVDSDVKDSSATLEVELVKGIDRTGTTMTLQRGCNALYVSSECELFISYLLNDVDKSCNDYPDIKVHIEGGTCNGCFDMRGHGHTNADWEWMKQNMFSGTYLHVKGNSTMLNTYRERVVDPSNSQNVEGIMNIFDYVFDNLESLAGCDKWKQTGRYKMMVNNFDSSSGNPYWSAGAYGYAQPGIYYNGIFNFNNLTNVGTDGGSIWVIEHELGHGHQTPINTAGMTESSNNSLAQCVNFLTTTSARGQELFATTRSSRGAGVDGLINHFNNCDGYSWIDYSGNRSSANGYSDLWISNKMFFQLWLYFDYMGHYVREGETSNSGFDFMSDLYDALRADPVVKSRDSSNPAAATDDYLKVAKYAAQITQTDLSEFFEAWGFWKTAPTVSVENDLPDAYTWYYGDYGNFYVQTSEAYVETIRSAMQQYAKKGGNIMFLDDRCKGSTLATYNNATPESFGETGYYETYDAKITQAYEFTISGTTVTLTGGQGAVGFKVYDANGNLVAISNTLSFTVNSAVAAGLKDGTYTIVAAQGDGVDYAMGQCASQVGDVNRDGSITIADVTALVNIILGKDAENLYDHVAADVNCDGGITIADVTALVNLILGKTN